MRAYDVKIPADYGTSPQATAPNDIETDKKIEGDVDDITEFNEKSVKLYHAIHEYSAAGYSKREIAVYRSTSAEAVQKRQQLQKYDHLSRSGIFCYLWMNVEITQSHKSYLMDTYPQIRELRRCIRDFREIFNRKNMPMLYLFIERYKFSELKEIATFAKGLEKDHSAVENAVASPLSNGFVEGTNSKLKMVKRTMYGRCSKQLLEAKLMYDPR